jgi:hypothetical protein
LRTQPASRASSARRAQAKRNPTPWTCPCTKTRRREADPSFSVQAGGRDPDGPVGGASSAPSEPQPVGVTWEWSCSGVATSP